jgi:hypothetical protein
MIQHMSERKFALNDQCGEHFHFRDLVQCSDTWKELAASGIRMENLPVQDGTWTAMKDICEKILDPVWKKFGAITLTYGFASNELDKAVRERAQRINKPANTTRNGDQHAGCELNARGKPICDRLGIGVDFKIENISSGEIGSWIEANSPFDRLYYYDDTGPLHVSFGPEHSRYRWNRNRPKS